MQAQMQFKGYRWKLNPAEITVSYASNIKEHTLPFAGSCLQELGKKKRVVSGKGCFLGKDSLAQFRELSKVFQEGGAGILSIPGFPPFRAVFSALTLHAQGRPGETPYTFTFLEEEEPPVPAKEIRYICRGGESLWKIAAETGVPLLSWIAQNRIPWIHDLTEGTILFAKEERK